MPEFCDVALPVPLDIVFTYADPRGNAAGRGWTRAGAFPPAAHVGHRRWNCMIVSQGKDQRIIQRARCRAGARRATDSAWANGLPTTIWRRSAKCSAPCCRWAPNSRGPSVIASPKQGHKTLHEAGHEGSRRAPRKLPKSKWQNFACWTIWRNGEGTGRKLAGRNPGVQGSCWREWCGRNGLCARICPRRGMPRARSRSRPEELPKASSTPTSKL